MLSEEKYEEAIKYRDLIKQLEKKLPEKNILLNYLSFYENCSKKCVKNEIYEILSALKNHNYYVKLFLT